MDMLQFKYEQSIFAELNRPQFWNPALSWKNKYEDYDKGELGEKFFGSKSVLVFLTDGWHLLKVGMLSSLSIAIAILLPDWNLGWGWLDGVAQLLAIRAVFGIGFYMSYDTTKDNIS